MTNKEKLTLAIGKLLDQINESVDKKEVPHVDTVETLRTLANISGFMID